MDLKVLIKCLCLTLENQDPTLYSEVNEEPVHRISVSKEITWRVLEELVTIKNKKNV